jgi:hypothetical protein
LIICILAAKAYKNQSKPYPGAFVKATRGGNRATIQVPGISERRRHAIREKHYWEPTNIIIYGVGWEHRTVNI